MSVSRPLMIALVLCAGLAHAQVELVDPDAPKASKKQPSADDTTTTTTDEGDPDVPDVDSPDITFKKRPKEKGGKDAGQRDTVKDRRDAGLAAETNPRPRRADPPPSAKPAPTLTIRPVSDADLEQAWLRWKKVESGTDFKAEQAARAELVSMKTLVGATDMENWAMGLLRLSALHAERGDTGAAVEIGASAIQLAPHLPSAWYGLAKTYFTADPTEVSRVFSTLAKGVSVEVQDPRFSRAVLADVVATVLLAFVLTCIAVLTVLVVRRAYFFFFDFHFLFPRAASRWQTTALAVVLLVVPIVFRMGVAPALLALFAAVTLYLSVTERVLVAGLIALLGVAPLVGGWAVERASFGGTAADELFTIERGGTGVEPLVQKYEGLAAEDKVGFPELYVLGHHHLRRGRLDLATQHFRRALALNPQHAGASVNMGVLFFLKGDLENSRALLEGVTRSSPGTAAAFFDLGRVFQRRVQLYGDASAGEVDRALKAFGDAAQLDPTMPTVSFDEKQPQELAGTSLVRTVPLEPEALDALARTDDAGARVRSQLSLMLLGDLPEGLAIVFPGLMAALLFGFGFLSNALGAARECNRCGKAVSARADPDLSPGSPMCTQCVNVFVKKNLVAPSLKVRKQLEIARYQSRVERTALILGALWSGMGHVFSGSVVRGGLTGFAFIAALSAAWFRRGFVRAPFEAVPGLLKAVPLVLFALALAVTSFRALRRKQG